MLRTALTSVSLSLLFFTLACSSAPQSSDTNSTEDQGIKFYVDPYSQAANDARNMRSAGSPDAHYVEYIAKQGAAVWYGEWSGNISQAVQKQVKGALEQDALAVMVAYNIPNRDCGQYSAGGLPAEKYRTWVDDMATSIGQSKALVILEPDALAHDECLTEERYSLLNFAVKRLKAQPNVKVYIDAGHSRWLSVDDVSKRLKLAGIANADGFALNTSNYQTTESNTEYGKAVSAKVNGKHFVIDTSRNGTDPKGSAEWCNPSNRSLGIAPTSLTGEPLIDAYLWAKIPGESDGACNGGPAAGQWWRDRAIELARNAGIKEGQASDSVQSPAKPSVPVQVDTPKPTPVTPVVEKPSSNAPAPRVPSAGSGSIEVTIGVQSQWENGGCYTFSFLNKGTATVQNWTMTLNLHGGTITNEWNLSSKLEVNLHKVGPGAAYLRTIPAGQSVRDAGFCLLGTSLKPSLVSIK